MNQLQVLMNKYVFTVQRSPESDFTYQFYKKSSQSY